jgi:uncharacterized protein YggL (DUF469 family)
MNDIELTPEEKISAIKELLKEVNTLIFKLTCAHSANKKVGADDKVLQPIVDELTRLEGLRMDYLDQISNLEKEANE